MTEVVNRNWYSPESKKAELATANAALKEMKSLEKIYKTKRHKIIEKTPLGERVRYIKKE